MIELDVHEPSQVSAARRAAAAAAEAAGFGEVQTGKAALVATELATNLHKHGGGGRLLISTSDHGLDLIAIDTGPGIADLRRALGDGYSTAGTSGNGLGAVARASQVFEVASWPGLGTAVLAHVARSPADPAPAASIGAVMLPKPGEEACGDGWACHDGPHGRTVLVVDGLGHGPAAATAAHAALRHFVGHASAPLEEIIAGLHGALRPTRGGAVAVARVQRGAGTVSFAGVGNISGSLLAPGMQPRRMVSHNGTAGHAMHRVQAFDYPYADGLLVMHSDGVSANWSAERYPGLTGMHPLLVAAVIYRDHGRRRDDATVVVCRTWLT